MLSASLIGGEAGNHPMGTGRQERTMSHDGIREVEQLPAGEAVSSARVLLRFRHGLGDAVHPSDPWPGRSAARGPRRRLALSQQPYTESSRRSGRGPQAGESRWNPLAERQPHGHPGRLLVNRLSAMWRWFLKLRFHCVGAPTPICPIGLLCPICPMASATT
jgi:hypothetical protein